MTEPGELTEAEGVDSSAAYPRLVDMDIEEARRRIFAAIRVLTEHGFSLQPAPEVCFTVVKPDGWRRHQVVCVAGEQSKVVERFWSWDRADDLAQNLNAIRRTLA